MNATWMVGTLVLSSLACSLTWAAGVANHDQVHFFVPNQGQWDGDFAFRAEVGNGMYFVTRAGMTIDLREYEQPRPMQNPLDRLDREPDHKPVSVRGHVLKLDFVNANPSVEIVGENKLPSYSNYFLGRDSCRWRGRVPHYQKVLLKQVWDGIDVELVAQEQGVETVYHVAPFADLSQIQIEVEGLESPLSVDANGRVLFSTSLGPLTEQAPFAYQPEGGIQKSVPVHYRVLSSSRYAPGLSAYNPEKEVVIDPLLYGTLLGGTGPDYLYDMVEGADGWLYTCGQAYGSQSGFPTTPGAYQEQSDDTFPGFVTVFRDGGDSLVFSTYFGAWIFISGTSSVLYAIDRAADGSIWFGGYSNNPEWPVTSDALDTTVDTHGDATLNALSADGTSFLYGTFLGGEFTDGLLDLTESSDGMICGVGWTSGQFPVTPDALYPEPLSVFQSGFYLAFNSATRAMDYATFLTGSQSVQARRLLEVGESSVWVSGDTRAPDFPPVTSNAAQSELGNPPGTYDCFLLHFDPQQNQILYGSFLGGMDTDQLGGACLVGQDSIIVGGTTRSPNFPATSSAFDTSLGPCDTTLGFCISGFLTVIDVDSGILYSTFLGDSGMNSYPVVVNVWSDGSDVVAVGSAQAPNFPTTPGAFDTVFNGNDQFSDYRDVFVTRLSGDLSLLNYSTFIGGWHSDYCLTAWIENRDTVWIGGTSGSPDFPITPNAFQDHQTGNGDCFVVRFSMGDTATGAPPRERLLPTQMSLEAYPNPFNSIVTLQYQTPSRSRVTLTLDDVLGRQVLTRDLGILDAGEHQEHVDLASMPSGIYFARLHALQWNTVQKLILLR